MLVVGWMGNTPAPVLEWGSHTHVYPSRIVGKRLQQVFYRRNRDGKNFCKNFQVFKVSYIQIKEFCSVKDLIDKAGRRLKNWGKKVFSKARTIANK